MKTYSPYVSYFFLFPLFLLVCIALTVINPFSACFIDLSVGRINPGTFGAALTTRWAARSEASMTLPSSTSDWSFPSQSSSLWFGLSNLPCQLSQFSVSEMVSGAQCSSLATRWWWFLLIMPNFILEFVLRGGPSQTKLVAKVICLTI